MSGSLPGEHAGCTEQEDLLSNIQNSEKRNYQLDVMKVVFAFLVLISHTDLFMKEDTYMPHALGAWAVFFFFIVSGMLMVHGAAKSGERDPAETSWAFIINKVRKLFLPCFIALLINFCIFQFINIKNGVILSVVDISKIIPQILFMTSTSVDSFMLNSPAWYISAMLIVMLPLYYLLRKNRNFYLYIFSPICAILGYMYCYNRDGHYFAFFEYFGFLSGGLVLALMGISFGSISYIVAQKMKSCDRKAQRITVTAAELLLYALIFVVWFAPSCDADSAYSVMLLLPLAVGITFSKASYISELFYCKYFRICGEISLAVYLNHISAWRIVREYFMNESYEMCVFIMILLTAIVSVFYILIIKLLKMLWNKVRHMYF